ncbi:GyrI-like domain-containing protein [Pseudonocardia sp. DSM 110487]|uniref:GyrI-like domain-containing protein n=1 Tax=Pseudonocardia sp. DSM 110487 TaxID=2865833 RepID=UPI001C699DC9|nr:GyrI-like domain-containing protein [Pseudonocardia sp. DSM 110487]QYN39920.1 GyrI-like domain-containing protein [Pseudonocardia sp. DSM 110487]
MNLDIVDRPAQPYVAVRRTVTMQTFPEIADRLPGLFGWLAERGIAPAGPPFFRYLVIDMERELDVEAGVPVATPIDGDGEVLAGELPAGRYAATTHVGHPDELIAVTGAFLDEAAAQGLSFDATETERGTRWGCRLELLLTNPAEQPDMNKWETTLAFRLVD